MTTQAVSTARSGLSKTTIAAYGMTGLVAFAMFASAMAKFAGVPQIVDNLERSHLGSFVNAIAVIEVMCATLFVIPKTSSLGTLLVTGYFGGAVVAHLAANDVSGVVPALVLGALAWGANYLRNRQMFGSL
ncbi:MAG: hypothetical protein RJA70_1420 [Pseudomonadota bacterium]|jgi:type IV secretory pathway VirB2 component (pilin)